MLLSYAVQGNRLFQGNQTISEVRLHRINLQNCKGTYLSEVRETVFVFFLKGTRRPQLIKL